MTAQQPVNVRRRRPEDIPALAQVLVRVHARDGYPVEGVEDAQSWIQPNRELAGWTALVGAEPIGHISLTEAGPSDDAARLWVSKCGAKYDAIAIPVRLFVDPSHRALGVGRQLMLAAYEHASSLGKRLVFDVMLKDENAIRLYEALGAQRLGTITHRHSGGLEEPAAVYIGPGTGEGSPGGPA